MRRLTRSREWFLVDFLLRSKHVVSTFIKNQPCTGTTSDAVYVPAVDTVTAAGSMREDAMATWGACNGNRAATFKA